MNFGTIESQEVQQLVLPDRLPDSDSIWSRQDGGAAPTLFDEESSSQQVEKALMEIEEELEKEQELAMEMQKAMETQFEQDVEKAKQASMEVEKAKAMELEMELEKQRAIAKAMELEKELEKQREKEKAMELEKDLEKQREKEKKAMELEKELEKQREKEKAMELEKQQQKEKAMELEKQREKEKAMELEKQREKDKAMELEKQREKEKAMELEKQQQKEKAMELEKQRLKEKAMELEKQREKEKAMVLEKELEKEIEKQFEKDMEKAKQASMEMQNEQPKTGEFTIQRDLEDEDFNRQYRAYHGRLLKMDAVAFAKAQRQMQIHPRFVEFLVCLQEVYDEVDLMAAWELWCEHNGVVRVEEPKPPPFERHTTKENIDKFFDPKTYKVIEDGYADGAASPEKLGEHRDGELPPKSESLENDQFALLTAADQRKLRSSRKEENAEKRTRLTKKGPADRSTSAAHAGKKRPVEEEEEDDPNKENEGNKKRKSAQLVEKERQEEFKKNLKLSFNEVFSLGEASMCFWEKTVGGLKPRCTFHCRLVKNTKRFSLNIYWTRLQVGVRNKETKRQVWTTSQSTAVPSFGDKIRLGNAAVTHWKMRCAVCITCFGISFYLLFIFPEMKNAYIKKQWMCSNSGNYSRGI